VIFYFCFVATLVHLVLFMIYPMPLPQQFITYVVLVGVGISATCAQYFLTMSYQKAHAALNAAVSYLYPVSSMLLQIILFQERPDLYSWCGAGLILLCGVALPFLKVEAKRAVVKVS
jgi:S-adenosylmethionine uptake transporter